MGAGASAENARTTVAHMLTGKPADASDIKVSYFWDSFAIWSYKIKLKTQDLEQARAEIRNLRRIARDFQNQLRGELDVGYVLKSVLIGKYFISHVCRGHESGYGKEWSKEARGCA